MDKQDGIKNVTNSDANSAKKQYGLFENRVGVVMDLKTFENKVNSGEITDETGMAELLINGVASNYHIHIGRRCVTRGDGTLITKAGLLKMHDPEELTVFYTKRSKRMMSIAQYKHMMRVRDAKQGRTV